jgi:hypothetical protein
VSVYTARQDPLVNFRELELPKATYLLGRQPPRLDPPVYGILCYAEVPGDVLDGDPRLGDNRLLSDAWPT